MCVSGVPVEPLRAVVWSWGIIKDGICRFLFLGGGIAGVAFYCLACLPSLPSCTAGSYSTLFLKS